MSFMLRFPYMYIIYSDHIRSQPPSPVSFPCCPFPLPIFSKKSQVVLLHPLEDTELDEKAGFCFSPIKLIAFKYKIMKTLGSITDSKV